MVPGVAFSPAPPLTVGASVAAYRARKPSATSLTLRASNQDAQGRSRAGALKRIRSVPKLLSTPVLFAIVMSMALFAPMLASAFEVKMGDIMEQYQNEQAERDAAKREANSPKETEAPEEITMTESDAIELWHRKESKVPTHSYEIREKIKHDPMAFTQGLEIFEDGFLEGTGQYGRSQVRKLRKDGTTRSKISNQKGDFGEGVTAFGPHIMQLTWRENKAFLYNRETLDHEGGFEILYEGWGACHDDEKVIISDGTNKLRFNFPPPKGSWSETVKEVFLSDDEGNPITHLLWKTSEGIVLKIPVRLNELEVIEGEIWANVWPTETVVRIEMETGKLLGWVDMRGLREDSSNVPNPYPICRMDVLNGIAANKTEEGDIHVYVTGKCWPRMYDLLIMERDDCGFKGELLALPKDDLKGYPVTDFFQPREVKD